MENKEQLDPKADTQNAGEESLANEKAEKKLGKTKQSRSKDSVQDEPEQPQNTEGNGESEAALTQTSKEQLIAEEVEEIESVKPPSGNKSPIAETADETAVQEPDAEKPAEEAPAELPVKEPVAEKPTEEVPAEEPPVEEPVAEKPTEEVPAEEPPVEEPVAEKPTEEVPAEEPPVEEPVAEKPTEEVPAEEPPVKEPVAEKPTEEVPAEDKPVEEPVAEKPTEEVPAEDKPVEEPVAEKKEDPEDEDDNDALLEKYSAMTREELVLNAEALVTNEDVNFIRKHIGFIKVAYRNLLRNENMASYEQRLEKDADEQSEDIVSDTLTDRFDAAFAVYKEKKTAFDKALEVQMQDNLQAKETILEELRQLIDSEEELKKTYDQFNALQERWRSVGPVPRGAKGTLWNNYHFLVEKFFDKVNINKELKDLDLKKNLEAKTELCEKAEELLLETSITKSFQQLQKLHEAWKEIGPVPQDKKDEIWERFKSATDKLNKRRQEHYEGLREEQSKNYAAKLLLCDKAEDLLATIPETPRQWQQQTEKINELFNVWKTIGFAPKKVNNEVWNRFRNALDTFFSNKKEFFRKYKDQQKDNYNQKLNLCLQAEALKDSEDWRSTTEALISLQQEWKNIGPVPAKFSDKIWKRFRQACDTFFNKKSEHFANIGEKQDENLRKKLDLIEKIKTHQYSDDNKENLETLKEFQRHWMDIGHVPIKQKDKVQGEFRKAIDQQFEILNISKKAKTTLSFRSKIENLKSAPNADNIIQKERNLITSKIKTLEGDIKVLENNIGFFASSKKADILKAEFEEKIEKAKNEISVLKEKMKILSNA